MKKAGIITIFGEHNFGNRLQNYAVQETLKRFDLDVETIKYIGMNDTTRIKEKEKNLNRYNKFKEFNENIKFANETIYKEIDVRHDYHEDFDYFVIGSDQIWNYTFNDFFSDKTFATFAPKHKKIAFSASFGIKKSPDNGTEHYEICKKGIEDIKAVSVREDAGKTLVEEISGRSDAEVLVDPTMMLTCEDWEKVMKKPEILKTDKFIVKSFLGDTSDEIMQEIAKVAKENDCEIIDISDHNSPYFEIGPSEFLYLEKNAFMVATDSFHACVFSILFSTPFIVFEREQEAVESMYSRIETLLGKFNMEDRIFKNKITEDMLKMNFSGTSEILKYERDKTMCFLENALS